MSEQKPPREPRKAELTLALLQEHEKASLTDCVRALASRGYKTDIKGANNTPTVDWNADVCRPREYAELYFRHYPKPDVSDIEVEVRGCDLADLLEK